MKRHLAMRDRAIWVIAVVAVGVTVYLVLPIWVIATAAVLLVIVPLLLRRSRRHHARRWGTRISREQIEAPMCCQGLFRRCWQTS